MARLWTREAREAQKGLDGRLETSASSTLNYISIRNAACITRVVHLVSSVHDRVSPVPVRRQDPNEIAALVL